TCIPVFLFASESYSEDETVVYSLLVGWKTEGSHELLAKRAKAFKQFKTDNCLFISLGSLLGSTRLVQNDNGIQFLETAYQAGMDYIIPAAGEFMFGVETFKIITELSNIPTFISANIVDEKTRKPIVKPYVIWNVSGLRICIIGLTDMNIMRDSPDELMRGIDIIQFEEALKGIWYDVMSENADIVIAAGRMDRESIINMAKEYPYINAYITNNQSGGFSDKQVTTSTFTISGKPVYIVSEQKDHLSEQTVKIIDGIATMELTDITLGDEFPPDKEIAAQLNETLEKLKREDYEESVTITTGTEVASILRKVFDVDVALLERQSLYYYPLEDSLTVIDVRKVIKPSQKLVSYSLKGSLLKSVWEQSTKQKDPSLRLNFAGLTTDGKVDSIPIQDDREYYILTTAFLRSGGNGYNQFILGTDDIAASVDILSAVESFLIAKEERLRKAAKKKIWSLTLGLDTGSSLNRIDVDRDKSLYEKDIPEPFYKQKEQFAGYLTLSSINNIFKVVKDRHDVFIKLNMQYIRSGYRAEKGNITYKEAGDKIELYNKYTYHLNYKIDPYMDVNFESEFYPDKPMKQPLIAKVSSGLTRTFKKLWDLDVNIGIHGTRNYITLENTFGANGKFFLNKTFSEKSPIKKLSSDTNITWSPMSQFGMAFFISNQNNLKIQAWKNFNIDLRVDSYAYRNTKYRKVATGFIYFLLLNYGMNWKF
ncbi:MAG TPA: 5'-nucleotidase C-terminal domain-containing protein, partial [Anaerolineae bacterium]|nr:5'-nucleotidase C-terminal domain-containing protein [Anaerolineae bacterium]